MTITTLDRMFFVAYFRNYLIVLTSLLSLYIIVDLFTNLDEFTKRGFVGSLRHIGWYYSVHVSQIFDRLCEAVSLLGAMFTVAWMQRNNELLPQLSAGISTRRVLLPILLGCAITLAMGPLNQEFIIPRIADELTTPRDDPNLEKPAEVRGAFDSSGTHLEGVAGFRNEGRVRGLAVTFPGGGPAGMIHLYAYDANYIPPGDSPLSGGWVLYQTIPETLVDLPPHLERLGNGKYFLHTADVDFDTVTRVGDWYLYSSTPKLQEILAKPDTRRQPAVAVVFHMRLTRPLVGAILVLLGLAVILRDQNRHVFINAGLCLVLCAVFYATVLGCKSMGDNDVLPPALAAWLPVLIFGPISMALFDAIHT